MGKNTKILVGLITVVVLFFASCKSEPEVKEEPKIEPVVGVQNEAEIEANKEKKRLLAELQTLQGEDGAVAKARARAVDFNADKSYPEQFEFSDNLVAKAKSDADAEKLKEAIAEYKEAIVRYDTLSNLMIASQMRAEIEENNFEKYASKDFEVANNNSKNTIAQYSQDYNKAKETSDQTVELYKKVLNKGYNELAKVAQAEAKSAKADCDSIKASRSQTDDYNIAVRLFNVARAEASNSEYKKAFVAYEEASKKFKDLYETVSVKRAEAKKAMEEAAKKQAESKKLALEADEESPLTEAGEGFGEEDLELEDKTTPMTDTPLETTEEDEGGK